MEALVGIVVGSATIYLWLRYMGASWKRHKQEQRFEKALRDAREGAAGPTPYRLATPADKPVLERLRIAESHESALALVGFRPLGELILERAGKPVIVLRALVSADRRTVASTAVSVKPGNQVLVALSSYTGEVQVATRRGHVTSLAVPPFVRIIEQPPATPIRDLVAAHQAPPDARPIETLDDVLARMVELRDRTLAWRAAQPPDELLDADLRALLGSHYDQRGKLWAARLRDKLPQATARRV